MGVKYHDPADLGPEKSPGTHYYWQNEKLNDHST